MSFLSSWSVTSASSPFRAFGRFAFHSFSPPITKSTEQQVSSYVVMNFYPNVCQSQGFDSDDREYCLIIQVTSIFRNPQHLSLLLKWDSATLSDVLY